MKQRAWFVTAALVAILAVGVLAQPQKVYVNIEFAFMAADKSMAAGKYELEISSAGPVLLRASDGKAVSLPVITRLGRHDNDSEPELIFDKVAGVSYLSEVWLPGADGYLLRGTKEQHDHAVVGGPKGKKK